MDGRKKDKWTAGQIDRRQTAFELLATIGGHIHRERERIIVPNKQRTTINKVN